MYSPACPLQRGTPCTLDFTGFYRLESVDRAVVVIQAFEDGSDTSTASGAFGLPKGSAPWKARLPFAVGPNAQRITFAVTLKTETGQVLHTAPSTTYEVHS